ncbi:M24 family metallopeptidase [Chloroflexota bacterium]
MRFLSMNRVLELQRRMAEKDIGAVLITDPDSIYYFSGYFGYLGVDFGRPTMLFVPRSGDCTVITPLMESEMCRNMTWIEDIRAWADGTQGEWGRPLHDLIGNHEMLTLGIERMLIPTMVYEYLKEALSRVNCVDVGWLLSAMRMIKSVEEIEIMRQAGQVAVAMAEAAQAVIGEGVPEYEVVLAAIDGGTCKAAEFLSDDPPDLLVSPVVCNMSILQSGHDTCMVHRRSLVRRIQHGDPVYLCFCGAASFKYYKLGFDREFFVGSVTDEQAKAYEVAVKAQMTALEAIRPGVIAEDVHLAAASVYRDAGFEPGYRTGRSIGCSLLEKPELKEGDRTPLQSGMTFAVDGGITVPDRFGVRVGDSIVVNDKGFEYLTPYPKELCIL